MSDIILTTLNAKYAHSSFGLRYLMANLGKNQSRAHILEFNINQEPLDIAETILNENPKIVGIGVYIWNVAKTTQLIAHLKQLQPHLIVIIGGPEVSYEVDQQKIVRLADYVITGEADLAFAQLCEQILTNQPPPAKIIPAKLPTFEQLTLPYHLYTTEDIAHRVIYVEASRGCPFTCEFCLSSLDIPVRSVPLNPFLSALQSLLNRGAHQFKFVDRTFNLNLQTSRSILEFFLERYRPGLFIHFEMIPDRLPEALREPIQKFPPAALQFEVGIQTFNKEVADLIHRRQDNTKVEENLKFLRQETGVHIHADLIIGLPGESIESFAEGFDRLVTLRPQEIQVGMLKRLRGTPIVRHDTTWGMVYSSDPPYEILKTKLIDFSIMQRLRRFARYWDLIANSGNFIEATPFLWADTSPFWSFLQFSDWLYLQIERTHGIALSKLAELLFTYLTAQKNQPKELILETLARDYQRGGRSDLPAFLKGIKNIIPFQTTVHPASIIALPRQARHWG